MNEQQLGTVVIGGSQAGLAVGYYLKQRALPFVILDENGRVGAAGRKRWDSLHLFTDARFPLNSGAAAATPHESLRKTVEAMDRHDMIGSRPVWIWKRLWATVPDGLRGGVSPDERVTTK